MTSFPNTHTFHKTVQNATVRPRLFPSRAFPTFAQRGKFHRCGGFSMIEVLVAILIVSIGLIGVAFTQSMSLKYAQSSNYRTQAVNLSSNLLEQIRANRAEASNYLGTFQAASTSCATTGNGVTATAFMSEWQCQLNKQLGGGAKAVISRTRNQVQVQITWTDAWWETTASKQKYTYTATTQM